jgi:hypothetical protein
MQLVKLVHQQLEHVTVLMADSCVMIDVEFVIMDLVHDFI